MQYLWNEARYDQRYYWWLIGSCIRAFDRYRNQWPWMTLNGHFALRFKIHVSQKCERRQTHTISGKDVAQLTVVSDNIRFMRTFAGFLGDEASNDSGVIENVDFQGFPVLRIRNLRKWGQHYYIVLFSPLSPFLCLTPNRMTLNDLEWPFYVKFCFFRRYAWSSEAWLSELGYS